MLFCAFGGRECLRLLEVPRSQTCIAISQTHSGLNLCGCPSDGSKCCTKNDEVTQVRRRPWTYTSPNRPEGDAMPKLTVNTEKTGFPTGQILYREDPDDGDGTHKPSFSVAFKSPCGRQSPRRAEPRCARGDYLQMCASRNACRRFRRRSCKKLWEASSLRLRPSANLPEQCAAEIP